ncbi:MAG: anion permease, partial [Thermoplasmata archaeon]|nr:anion permease [Thermoplasmata archaeon]
MERESKTDRKSFSGKDVFFIVLSFSVIALFLILPQPSGLSRGGWLMTGILVMAIILWITTPIPIAVTGLLIMIM